MWNFLLYLLLVHINFDITVSFSGTDMYKFPKDIDVLEEVYKVNMRNPDYIPKENHYFIQNSTFSYIRDTPGLCRSHSLFVMVLVKSAPENFRYRQNLRNFWLNKKCWGSEEFSYAFLLGVPQSKQMYEMNQSESAIFGDMIIKNFTDSYYNNTYKMMMGFEWAHFHCKNARYVFFVDDDYCVNPINMLKLLRSLSKEVEKRFVAGHVWPNAKPRRSESDKWYVSKSLYPHDLYPQYIGAGAFIVSKRLIGPLLKAMIFVDYFPFDDIFLGIILNKMLIVPIHIKDVYSEYGILYNSKSLFDVIASHQCKHFMEHARFKKALGLDVLC